MGLESLCVSDLGAPRVYSFSGRLILAVQSRQQGHSESRTSLDYLSGVVWDVRVRVGSFDLRLGVAGLESKVWQTRERLPSPIDVRLGDLRVDHPETDRPHEGVDVPAEAAICID